MFRRWMYHYQDTGQEDLAALIAFIERFNQSPRL
jgi:hypothetical protein